MFIVLGKNNMLNSSIIIDRTLLANIIIAFSIPLPLPLEVVSYIVGFAVVLLMTDKWKVEKNTFKKFKYFYFLYLFGWLFMFFSPAKSFNSLEVRLPFLLFPFFLRFPNRIDLVKKAFIIGVLVYAVYTMYNQYVMFWSKSIYLQSGWSAFNMYSYKYQMMKGYVHETYMAMYIYTAFIILSFNEKYFKNYNKLMKKLIGLSFFITSFTSRMTYIIVIGYLAIYLYVKINYIKGRILYLFSILIIGTLFVYNYSELLVTSMYRRVEIWKSSLYIIRDNFFLGTGTNSADILIGQMLIDNSKIVDRLGREIGTHNMIFDFVINYGVAGIILLLLFSSYLYLNFKTWEGKSFLFIIFSYGLIEHILNLQWGVIFIVYFLLLYLNDSENKLKPI